ncbi:BNR-4 repeat-containing protein [Klebsiella grimontii]|uniref:BNR-4 repeat-containing protein n=1 Tax=Klebsiella grimontii TaxID=2058152 RepID=UPI0012B7C923
MAADLNPPLGTTTPEIFMDNVKRADELVNGPSSIVLDRGGEPLDSWRLMMDKNEDIRQNIMPLSRQYMTLAAAQADIMNIPEGSSTYVRSQDDSALAVEYMNVGGTLTATGRKMTSQQGVTDAAYQAVGESVSVSKGKYVASDNAVAGVVTDEYININGVKSSSTTRKLISLPLSAGESVFFKAKHLSKQIQTEAEIPAAIFIPSSGASQVVEPAPLALNVSSYTNGHFTASAAGIFYLNTVLYDDLSPGTLISGVTGQSIFYRPETLDVEDIGITVPNLDMYQRDIQGMTANGKATDVTALAKLVMNQVLFSNGAIQTITPDSSTYGDWAIGFIAARAGDKFTYNGWFNTFTTSTATYISQLDVNKKYVAALLGDIGLNGQYTRTVTATQDGYIAIRIRLKEAGVAKTHTITRTAVTGLVVTPMDNFLQTAGNKNIAINLRGTDNSVAVPGYIDNIGAVVSSTIRWYRKAIMAAGQTAFYSGRSQSSGATIGDINAVLFVPVSTGVPVVVKGNPLALNGLQDIEGEFTATEAGTLYINLVQVSGVLTGALFCGVVGTDIFYKKEVIETESQNSDYVSAVAHKLDMDSIAANGNTLTVTGTAELENDLVLYKNGTKQISTNPGVNKIAYVPVRKGDIVTYQGQFITLPTGSWTSMSQLDFNKNYIQELLGDIGLTGIYTRSVTATQDGYIAIRIRLTDPTTGVLVPYSIKRKGKQYFSTSTEAPIVTPSMEQLPVNLDSTWLYNSPSYQQNGIVVRGGYIYVVCIATGRMPHILQRKIAGGEWKDFDLSTIAGNPFQAPNAQDGHNSFSIEVTKDGYIIVTGNHHADVCKCVISNNPHDITAWTQILYSNSSVTYPRFVHYTDGTTQIFWRQGASGSGQLYMSTFDDTTRTFGAKVLLVNNPTGGNPYEQTICVGNDGSLHICFGIRTDGLTADSNYGMFYAKSMDKGLTFSNAVGSATYSLPLSESNAERPVVVVQESGYVNQNGACVDLNGRFHTVYWQKDSSGYTQIIHLWFDGTTWHTESVSRFTYTEVTSGNLLSGTSSRPQICCTRYGKIYVVYRTTEDGRAGKIRVINVTTAGQPVDAVLAVFDVNKTELSVNVWDVLQTGIIRMMLYRGVNRTTVTPVEFLDEPAWIIQAQLP